jgi:hypothetical protein
MTRHAVHIDDIATLQQWQRVLMILSLDRVTPFWEDMGVHLSESERVKDLLRDLVTEQQRQPLDADMVVYPRQICGLIDATLDRIAEVEGDEGANGLAEWIALTYLPNLERERWYETWRILFLRLAEGNISQLSGQGISDEKLSSLTALVTRWQERIAQVDDRLDQADALPLTGWDGRQYSLYRHETPDISPLDYVSSFLNNYTFAPFWQGLVELLSPGEMSVLDRWGQLYTSMKTSIPAAYAALPGHYVGSPVT